MKLYLASAVIVLGALAGCDSNRENVRDAQRDVTEARQDANKDISDAQANAVQNINEEKEEAAADIRDAQKDLAEAQREAAADGTTSATTRNDRDVKVTVEQCARFANTKEVKPEDKALYEACSKIDAKKFR
ncbi:MAG: hypothetical protein V4692_03275 [Bdellovibrionota bacterium]